MKILLVQPSITERNVTSFMYPPMGLVALVAYLQKEGHQVSLYDANIEKETANEIIDLIKKESPEIVGFGIMSVNFSKSLALAKEIKSISKDIVIIAGGVHPTVEPEQTLKSPYIDFIVRGEGELTTAELLKAIEKKEENLKDIKGLGFKKNGKIILNPLRDLIQDISTLPIPAYNLLNLKKYRAPYASRSPYMIMTRSRGCPFLCIFCGVGKMFGNRYRVQTPERSIEEVDYLVNQLGIKEIGFKDSEFTLAPKNVEKFCDLLIEKNYDLSWNCNGRINHATYPLLSKMKKAGCVSISYGIESGDQAILDDMKKEITIEQVREAIKITKAIGLRTIGNFMIGNPNDTKETIEKTIRFAIELDLDYANFGFTTPFPGTELRERAIKNNWILDERMEAIKYEDCIMNATSLPTPELKKYLSKAFFSFYFRPSYILKRLLMINNKDEIYNSVRGSISIIKDILRPKK